MNVRSRVIAALGSIAVVAGGLVGLAGPAQAVETITLVPGAYTPGQPWTVRVDGVPAMTAGNIYIFWLTFENLPGSRSNARPSAYGDTPVGEQTGAQCLAETGVSFSLSSGPGNPAPNGGTYLSTTSYNGCSWVSRQTFRFAFSGATGLGNSSVIDVTFPAGTFTLPDSGGYAVRFTAGADQQYPLDLDCVGACPVPVSVPVDPQGGTCRVTALSGFDGVTAVAPRRAACSRDGYGLLGFSTGSGGTGDQIAPGGDFVVEPGLTLYARWGRLPDASSAPDLTPGFGQISVAFRPPSRTYGPVTEYRVALQEVGTRTATWCVRTTNAEPCIFRGLNPDAKYRSWVNVSNAAGSSGGFLSAAVSPLLFRTPKGTRTKLTGLIFGRGSLVKVSGDVRANEPRYFPEDLTLRPYICIVEGNQRCKRIADFVAGVGTVTVGSSGSALGKYSFERRFAREHNRSQILIRMSSDGRTFTDVIRLAAVA